MPSLVFDKCCGCIELKTGCFIIGYLNLVGTLIFTIAAAVALVGGAVVATVVEADDKNDTQNIREVGAAITIIAAIGLLFFVLALAFAIVLLVGLHKDKPGHLKAYLIYSVIFMVMMIIRFIVKCATASAPAQDIVETIISIAFSIYFLLVIRSQYYQMKEPSRGPAIYSAA